MTRSTVRTNEMRSRTKSRLLWLGFVVSFVGLAYSLLAIVMVGSFSVSPNYDPQRVERNMSLWSPVSFLFFVVVLVCGVMLIRTYRNRKD